MDNCMATVKLNGVAAMKPFFFFGKRDAALFFLL
jgi:hypothetical protein